ncbi:MAG: tRNA epoxyqueuosine(34) reductase QueG, partial [Marinoscillum sp.]
REEVPSAFKNNMEGWAFGCDICQDVCPWNRFSRPHKEPAFQPQGWEAFSQQEWHEMTEEVFRKVFKKSAVKRTRFSGLKRNLDFLSQKGPSSENGPQSCL